jgi:hypothetical protein
MVNRRLMAVAPTAVDEATTVEQRLYGSHSSVDVALEPRRMKPDHVDNLFVCDGSGGKAGCYVFDKHIKSVIESVNTIMFVRMHAEALCQIPAYAAWVP